MKPKLVSSFFSSGTICLLFVAAKLVKYCHIRKPHGYVKSILESYGYQVDLAEDGLAAIEKAGKKVYDAVITDVEMPQLDGFNLTSHLRLHC